MPLVSTQRMLKEAQAGGYAVGAFNVENMEMAQAVVEAAVQLRAPVIVQTTPGTVKYADVAVYQAMVAALAGQAPVPVALHLDHGDSFELAGRAVRAGYTSVMIDGSKLPLQDNIALTRRVVEMAREVPVEAELGTVGGKEDSHDGGKGGYTDPADAARFVGATGIGSLAVAIGTAHGVYQGEPKLDIALLARIHSEVALPLVLHGTSGVPDEAVTACIRNGICKVNYATELRFAYSDGVKAYLKEKPDAYDPKSYGKAGRASVLELVKRRIALCGSAGKA